MLRLPRVMPSLFRFQRSTQLAEFHDLPYAYRVWINQQPKSQLVKAISKFFS